ncbi:MAG: TIGR03364 family FAD-dependent oxidoreductase [Salinibacter sp.]
MSRRLVIVGSGITGLAHAKVALEEGWHVTVVERDPEPRGASVRNFGTLWPIGQPRGERRARANRSMTHWHEASEVASFTLDPTGSLHLAYLKEGWSVLREYAERAPADEEYRLLSAAEVAEEFPAASTEGLKGGLYSPAEAVVRPREAVHALIEWLDEQGVDFLFGRPVTRVEDGAVVTSDGSSVAFDRLVVCCGDVVNLLYVDELAEAGGRSCQIQMMRAEMDGEPRSVDAILAGDLTLRHYESFRECPSVEALAERIDREMAFHTEWGIHVLVAQHADGTLALGDSHEYGPAPTIGSRMPVDEAVLAYLNTIADLGALSIQKRWTGSYLKAPEGETYLHLTPEPYVDVVTGLGGAGMTLSFGVAEDTLSTW